MSIIVGGGKIPKKLGIPILVLILIALAHVWMLPANQLGPILRIGYTTAAFILAFGLTVWMIWK